MTIRVRNKNYWESEDDKFVEYVGKGSILENPFSKGCKRKLSDEYRKYLTGLSEDSPQWQRIMELRELHQKGEDLNLLCSCYPDPCHSTIISDAIIGLIKPKKA